MHHKKRIKDKTLFDFLSSSRTHLSSAHLAGEDYQNRKGKWRGSYILFSSHLGSEKAFGRGDAFISLAEAKKSLGFFFWKTMCFLGNWRGLRPYKSFIKQNTLMSLLRVKETT
jgi:hypothetical protein